MIDDKLECLPIRIKKLNEKAIVPEYQTVGAAAVDLHVVIEEDGFDYDILYPNQRKLYKTGLAIELPKGYEAQIRPRSGLALKKGITIVNSPGTIDCDYRGDIGIILLNTGDEPLQLNHGERIGQMVIAKYTRAMFIVSEELSETERGAGGFGHTKV